MSNFTGPHLWVKGEWESYGDYVHRDDVCSCGCIKRMAVTDDGDDVVDFYEKDGEASTHQPICKKRNIISVSIVADPTSLNPSYKQEIKVHPPKKIDYFDVYNY